MWTKETPTEPGLYWHQSPNKKMPICLVLFSEGRPPETVSIAEPRSIGIALRPPYMGLWHPVVPPELPESDDD